MPLSLRAATFAIQFICRKYEDVAPKPKTNFGSAGICEAQKSRVKAALTIVVCAIHRLFGSAETANTHRIAKHLADQEKFALIVR